MQLHVATPGGTDRHYVCYLAESGHVLDNEPRGKVPVVTDMDRVSNKRAIKVFKQLFPRAKRIFLGAINQFVIVDPPPTMNDLFIENYMQGVITYDELKSCLVW